MYAVLDLLRENLFYQLAAAVLVAAVVGAIGVALRQPLVVSFIAVGIVAGPSVLGLVTDVESIDVLAKMGIALLLFVVGLKLDVHLIRTLGPVALATGLGQVAFTAVFGFLIALGLGMPPVSAAYVAVALTFSSTIIIIKLLSDKRELDSLHGRIATGFLIVQDIVVVIVMIGITAWGTGSGGDATDDVGAVAMRGVLFLFVIVLSTKFGLPQLVAWLARVPEMLVLFAVAWAFALAGLGEALGFSKEVGAFLAGVCIASTPYREAVASRLVSLRDFLLLFFFLHLGGGLNVTEFGAQVVQVVVLSLFVLIGNPLIVMAIMGVMGYRRRTGFLAGLTVAQISEFSFILMGLGLTVGHVTSLDVGLVTLVGIVTITGSSYMIIHSHWLFERFKPWLRVFERKNADSEQSLDKLKDGGAADVVVFGMGRFGSSIIAGLRESGLRVLGVDFDPEAVRGQTVDCSACYGDASDPEFLAALPLAQVRWVVSTVADRDLGASLLAGLRDVGYSGRVALTVHDDRDAEWVRAKGADMVFLPYRDAGAEAAQRLGALTA